MALSKIVLRIEVLEYRETERHFLSRQARPQTNLTGLAGKKIPQRNEANRTKQNDSEILFSYVMIIYRKYVSDKREVIVPIYLVPFGSFSIMGNEKNDTITVSFFWL